MSWPSSLFINCFKSGCLLNGIRTAYLMFGYYLVLLLLISLFVLFSSLIEKTTSGPIEIGDIYSAIINKSYSIKSSVVNIIHSIELKSRQDNLGTCGMLGMTDLFMRIYEHGHWQNGHIPEGKLVPTICSSLSGCLPPTQVILGHTSKQATSCRQTLF